MADIRNQSTGGGIHDVTRYSNAYFVAVFMLTSIIVAAGICAAVLSMVWVSSPEPTFDFNRDMGWVIFAFLVCWAFTILAGAVLGIPVLLGLRKFGLDRRPEALLLAGMCAGTFFTMLMSLVVSGNFLAVAQDPAFMALGAGAGLAAGGLWWLFARRRWRKHG